MQNIRNFCIIAHIDHGKSTLADRMLEITGTIEARKMKAQVLDNMELERERGITIKMQPVRMIYHPKITNSKSQIPKSLEFGASDFGFTSSKYILNLIDTPGHIDFSYEVSRALKAVEGAVLLVDATQGVQAQTLSVLAMALEQGLVIIPALSKCDSPLARVEEVKSEIISLLNCQAEEIIETSGKTGDGVQKLLNTIVEKIPAPEKCQGRSLTGLITGKGRLKGDPSGRDLQGSSLGARDAKCQGASLTGLTSEEYLQALVFDFKYSAHRGIIIFVRIMSGEVSARENLIFRVADQKFIALEVGIFHPEEIQTEKLSVGEIGYIVTGIKNPGIVSVGDTIGRAGEVAPALPGYAVPMPVVWASIFPEDQHDLLSLRQSLAKLKLTDSSLFYEEESSGVLGKGFRCGFLGMLHLEIITERLKREFKLELVITQPSITYEIKYKGDKTSGITKIYSPAFFPEDGLIEKVYEPWIKINIIVPSQFAGAIMPLLYDFEAEIMHTENFLEKTNIFAVMPLRELMRGFFDKLKSVSSGYASLSYENLEKREAEVTKLSILINGEEEQALARVVAKRIAEKEAETIVEKLKNLLPRQMFELKIQAKVQGRIVSSRTVSAFRKDVTQHMYGGDITRKMKLREKQKKGKKKMQSRGKISIPQDVFIKIMKPD